MTSLIGWTNHLANGSLSAGSSAAGMDPSQLVQDQGSSATAWQTAAGVTTSAGGAWFEVGTGLVLNWHAFGLFRTNLTTAATVRWRVGWNPAGASPNWDSGTISAGVAAGFGQSVVTLPAGVFGSYCRCDINDSGNPDGFINIPLAFAGLAWQPARNLAPSTGDGRDGQTDEVVTRGGQEYPVARWQRRRAGLVFGRITAAEVATARDLDRASRLAGNVLYVPDSAASALGTEAVYGRFQSLSDLGYPYPTAEIRTWRAQITERL